MAGAGAARLKVPGLGAADLRRASATAAIGASGALFFAAVGIPAAPILGAMIAVAAAALSGATLGYTPTIRAPQLAVMGMAAGASVTPATIAVAAAWPLSILCLLIATCLLEAVGYLIYRRIGGFDPLTAFLAAAPGSLSAVLVLAEDRGADVPRIAVAQTLRVIGIVALTPFLLRGSPDTPPVSVPALLDGVPASGLTLMSCATGWFIARRLHWPIPAFLGVFVGCVAIHAAGTVAVRPPQWLVTIALVGLGGVIGSRFSGLKVRTIVELLPVSLLGMLATGAIGGACGVLVGHGLGIGIYPGLLAFAPGSMEMMIAVSITLGVEPAYVAAHHVTRTLFLLSAVPLAVRRLVGPGPRGRIDPFRHHHGR